ncbi:MAG: hypothetical protein IPM82_12270 [Saprospiraceae bacterium]|nr:hypothetical protein [Saprospiraceae bacterium]
MIFINNMIFKSARHEFAGRFAVFNKPLTQVGQLLYQAGHEFGLILQGEMEE